ncbi:hypothetical protein [Amycolatopsis sp. cmx-4-68]|uniref:hypothetical protein n=1 Tax=Amycolatopsis sp. cmx-4-68 TaxID=2790938 RepID=UPI00397DF7D0
MTNTPNEPGPTEEVIDAVARLQQELDELMGGQDENSAVESLDNAVASLKEVEQRNVSSVQLVAL